jgi:hypothetical protein
MIEDILDLITYIKHCESERTNKNKVIFLGEISAYTSLKIKEQSGINVEGFKISIDAYGVKHVLQGHGEKRKSARSASC